MSLYYLPCNISSIHGFLSLLGFRFYASSMTNKSLYIFMVWFPLDGSSNKVLVQQRRLGVGYRFAGARIYQDGLGAGS